MSTDEVTHIYIGGLESSFQVRCVVWGVTHLRSRRSLNREKNIDNIIFIKYLRGKL
jgi:hypothetical protein